MSLQVADADATDDLEQALDLLRLVASDAGISRELPRAMAAARDRASDDRCDHDRDDEDDDEDDEDEDACDARRRRDEEEEEEEGDERCVEEDEEDEEEDAGARSPPPPAARAPRCAAEQEAESRAPRFKRVAEKRIVSGERGHGQNLPKPLGAWTFAQDC